MLEAFGNRMKNEIMRVPCHFKNSVRHRVIANSGTKEGCYIVLGPFKEAAEIR